MAIRDCNCGKASKNGRSWVFVISGIVFFNLGHLESGRRLFIAFSTLERNSVPTLLICMFDPAAATTPPAKNDTVIVRY